MVQTTGVFAGYDDRRSHFTRRLHVAQQALRDALTQAPAGPVVVLDICAGEGQVSLPVVARHPRRPDVRAILVELDGDSVAAARARIAGFGLEHADVIAADAGLSDAYVGLPRAQVVVLSGVLAHLSPADRRRVIRFLPRLCTPGATLVWTIGSRFDPTRAGRVRRMLAANGVDIVRIEAVPHETGDRVRHEVGVGRLAGSASAVEPGLRLFRFRLSIDKRFPALRALVRRARGRR